MLCRMFEVSGIISGDTQVKFGKFCQTFEEAQGFPPEPGVYVADLTSTEVKEVTLKEGDTAEALLDRMQTNPIGGLETWGDWLQRLVNL